jgi:hypothetical protein
MIFALDAKSFLPATRVDDDCREFASTDTAGVKTFGIFLDVEAAVRVMTVDDNGALGRRVNVCFVMVPDLLKGV